MNILNCGKVGTYDRAATAVGVSRSKVFQHIALVKRLPAEFVNWLEGNDDPAVLAAYAESRLRPVTMIENEKEQWSALQALGPYHIEREI